MRSGKRSPNVVEIAYDPLMAVIRMELDVGIVPPLGGSLQIAAGKPIAIAPFEEWSVPRVAVAAVAERCGVRPAGFLAELVSRPGRRVHGWLATMAGGEGEVAEAPAGGGDPARLAGARSAGVILLVESGASDGAPRHSIPWLLVSPECRRHGAGRTLVAAAIDRARDLGARRVTIDTLDRWPGATAFWRAVGFQRV